MSKPKWLPSRFPASVEIPIVALDKTGTQVREHLDEETVAKYADVARSEGFVWPEPVVVWDGERAILADGFHRTEATLRAGFDSIQCEVVEGTRKDAILLALKGNRSHGLSMSNADKRKAVGMLLEDKEWATWSDHEIARQVGCSHPFVGKIRSSLVTVTSDSPRQYTNKQGKQAEMKTENIGKKAEPPKTATPKIENEEPLGELSPVDQALANGRQWEIAKRHLQVQVFQMFEELSKIPGGVFLDDNKLQEVKGKIANLVEVLRDTKPYAECPYCKTGCKTCRNSGYVPQHIHRNAPTKGDGK